MKTSYHFARVLQVEVSILKFPKALQSSIYLPHGQNKEINAYSL